ncbi:hypothetical protein BAUCODRAFT_396915 [Baudoinia panamericana UAMH 10762]|uniref:DUF1993 domain-containing protein n=1 Tax=Baudoinia panamericana (strain UAMH 10762) TaxID=717646 RepID=M2NJE8_BAUPA|nr:uncharacterized protein BAUCODRAFT_396915 [Baudoinia panamericana UAMH 10762]EMC99270.1 hypothetical protein BAUCODRAFT_396915 [Baudoinia panamericana UAMH 10762]
MSIHRRLRHLKLATSPPLRPYHNSTAMTSLYDQSVVPSVKYLKNLSAILEKGRAFADGKGKAHDEILNFRLIEDMRGLTYQVQAACNTVEFLLPRLAGIEKTHFPDDEKTFAELQDRIGKTIEIVQDPKVRPAMEGKEKQPILMPTKSMGTYRFETGEKYVVGYAMANFHFHYSTAYCILRHLGVPISAFDYLGKDTFVKVDDASK